MTLAHPNTVSYTDKYGRLLRYVDVQPDEEDAAIDVGYDMGTKIAAYLIEHSLRPSQ